VTEPATVELDMRPASTWSASNVARVERLEAAGLMRAAGRRAVEQAKRDGRWPG